MIGFLIFIHTSSKYIVNWSNSDAIKSGSGLSGTFGGNTAVTTKLGGQNAGNILSKITSWLASIFIILAIFISTLSGPAESGSSSIIKQAAEERNEENFNPIDPNQDAVLDLNEVTE